MRLKARAKRACITNKQIAHALKVHRVTVENWLNGKTKIPKKREKQLIQFVRKVEKAMER